MGAVVTCSTLVIHLEEKGPPESGERLIYSGPGEEKVSCFVELSNGQDR